MARSRSKRRRAQKAHPAGPARRPAPKRNPWRLAALAAVLAAGAAAAWLWYEGSISEEAFLTHAKRGEAALARVVRPANEGGGHVAPGEAVRYRSDPPTSGVHDPTWIDPGAYQRAQSRSKLVHSLEHGIIVVYTDTPGAAAREILNGWADLYGGPWSGIVLVPKPGLGEAVVLTAWNRLLRLERFDADAAAAFIDAYRGRGPENPVR